MKAHDPKLYREMSVPHDDTDKANEAIQAFFAEVSDLRKKHRLADVTVIVETPIMADDDETRGSATMHLGAYENRLPMIAREYGKQRKDYDELIARTIATGRSR